MQTAAEHIANSEEAMNQARNLGQNFELRDYYIGLAQVEATLALAVATLEGNQVMIVGNDIMQELG